MSMVRPFFIMLPLVVWFTIHYVNEICLVAFTHSSISRLGRRWNNRLLHKQAEEDYYSHRAKQHLPQQDEHQRSCERRSSRVCWWLRHRNMQGI